MRYIVKVYYKGSEYFGYQRQPNVPTVENRIIEALIRSNYIESPEKNAFRSASRTDKSVTALGNVFSFTSDKPLILSEINSYLPRDKSIICWASSKVDDSFSLRSSVYKKYWYIVPISSLFKDVNMGYNEIRELCSKFEGEHDFKLFMKKDKTRQHYSTIRKIFSINLKLTSLALIFEFIGESFLWEQIRRIMAYVLNYKSLSQDMKNLSSLLSANPLVSSINLKPADPRQLILVEHNYRTVTWSVDNKAINKLLSLLKKEYLSLYTQFAISKINYEYFQFFNES